MNVDSSYFLDQRVNAYVQTLGFTGVERSSGSPITIGGVSIQTPTGNGTNSSYWNNLLATQVAQALGQSTSFGNFVIDVKDNTVILISPPTAGSEKLELIKGSNSSIGMTVNAPSGWFNGVWYGENPWSSFVGNTYFSPSLVPVNVYSFGFTGGERSNGSNVTVAGVSFTTPVANTSNAGTWNNEIARLHEDALNSSDVYGTHAVDVSQNTSILITPRSFSDERVTSNSGQNSSIGVSLNMPSGSSGGTLLGENSWSGFFQSLTDLRGLEFSSSGQRLVGKDLNLPTGNAVRRVDAWIKSDQTSGLGSVVEWGESFGGRFGILVDGGGRIYFVGENLDLLGVSSINDSKAHKVSVVFDGSSVSIFIDDVLDIKATSSNLWSLFPSFRSLNTVDNDLLSIGRSPSGESFRGQIYAVAVYDNADPPSGGFSIPSAGAPNLVSLYDFTGEKFKAFDRVDTLSNLSVSGVFDKPIDYRTVSIARSISIVNEGAAANFTVSTVNVSSGTAVPYTITGVSAADVVGGQLSGFVTVGSNGQATISVLLAADVLTEGSETLTVTAQGQSATVTINDTSLTPQDTYALSAAASTFNEGSSATFTLSTTNVAAGTSVPYTISGVSASDVVGGQLSGTVTVGVNGQATISVLLAADVLTEGSETLTVTAQGQSATVTINDTSLSPQGTYALSAAASTFNEGSSATFTLSTANVAAGTSVPYTISGVSASDVVGGQLLGAVNIGTNGQASISVPLVADLFTEGNETLTITAGGQSASVTVLDTSISALVPTYVLGAAASSVNEGGVALFNLTTTNVAAGTGVNFLISGVSEADVVGGMLSGSAIIDTNGRANISVPIAADSLTEGTETLRVIVSDKTATMSIADTSVAQTTTNTTNITNNITNNVTNNSNTTTNINSGNTTNNFINSFNRTLKVFDVNVTNDTKVVVTRVGDITRIEGNQENNTVVGTDAIDRLLGGGGSDRFYSSKGNDVLDGGDGTDAVTFKGRSSDFRVEKVGGNWLVRDTRTDANVNQGEDTLTGVERVGFEDKVLALDTDGVAGKAYRVYKAAFNRDPMQGDASGLGFWIDKMDNAMDLIEVSARFVDSNEFRALYGTNPTNAQFLTKLYQNVLGRAPEATGYNWWLNELNTNPSKTKAKALADFAESGENQAGVASLIGSGITYEPWVG